ncbi:MAG: GntR family transcriptional regulator [Solirubrobacterales bacterium]|nr:MAG: GntR family transcriptional regulator [Solirubrobacterales bacterium]
MGHVRANRRQAAGTAGGCRAGSALPAETALAAEFGVARNTVRRALAELERDGLIVTLAGRGRVVSEPAGTTTAGYRRIADDLRQQITSGELATGQRVPFEADLMRRYGVSRGTARRGLALLEATGLVSAVHGKGRFVDAKGRRSMG